MTTKATAIRTLSELLTQSGVAPLPAIPAGWALRALVSDDNLAYLAEHGPTGEAIWVDPVREDLELLRAESRAALQRGLRFLAVIDTHTHADHVSAGPALAAELGAPYVMSAEAPSPRPTRRLASGDELPASAGPVRGWPAPGHTVDGMVFTWGPFAFTGDTVLFHDCGRDDLPGGDPTAHFESLQRLKTRIPPDSIFLPGHDGRGGRASPWAEQLANNPALTQGREEFIAEAEAFTAPPPRKMAESLAANTA